MQTPAKNWLIALLVNTLGLLGSFLVLYVACVAVVLQISTRANQAQPLENLFGTELLAFIIGLVCIGLVFHFIGKVYNLLIKFPR